MTTTTLRRPTVVPIPEASGVGFAMRGEASMVPVIREDGTYGLRRRRQLSDDDVMGDNERARHILNYKGFWHVAGHLPKNQWSSRNIGRPAKNPDWVLFYVCVLTSVIGSQRSAVTYLKDPYTWRGLRKEMNRERPAGFAKAPKTPPTLNALRHFLTRVNLEEMCFDLDMMADEVRLAAKGQALGMGFLDPCKRLSYDKADTSQWIAYDGSVFPAPSTHRPSEAKGHRVDSASGYHWKNGDKRVFGSKWIFGSQRTTDYLSRVILDFAHVTGPTSSGVGDEARFICDSALRMKEQFPGLKGIIVDGIFAGTHIEQMALSNIHVVSKPTAKRNPDRAKKGTHNSSRVEKSVKVDVMEHKTSGGRTCKHHIFSHGTDLVEEVLDANGDATFTPISVTGFKSRQNADGTWRHYLQLLVTCRHGEVAKDLPLFHTPRDGSKFNRGEMLRFYPAGSPQFVALYGRRNDTESLHNQVKLKMRRMPSYGKRTQMLFIMGLVLAHNAATAGRHRQAESVTPLADAG